jgi:putative membrane protein
VVAKLSIGFVMLMHWGFMILEMFFYHHPIGQKIFKVTPEFSAATKSLMFNQGLYNGFVAAALLVSLLSSMEQVKFQFALYGLICVILAGIVGALTVSPRIFIIQSVPALIALFFLLWAKKS